MKHINHKTVFVSLLAFFLLVSFTPPLKKTKKVEEKPIDTFLPMGGGIIKPTLTPVLMLNNSINTSTNVRNVSINQNLPITEVTNTNDIVANERSNEEKLDAAIQPITPLPIKPLPVANVRKINSIKISESTYKDNSAFSNLQDSSSINVTQGGDNDPIRFSLISNKNEVKVGEEFEILIKAELMDISPSLYFTFEELRGYSLKVLMPEGFVQTGGNYIDYLNDEITPKDITKSRNYTLKGYFTALPETPAFTLIRGTKNFNDKSKFIKKQTLQLSVIENKDCIYEEYHVGTTLKEEENNKYVQIFVKGDDKYLFSDDGINFTSNNEFKLTGREFKGYVVSERNIGCPQALQENFENYFKVRTTTASPNGSSLTNAIPFCSTTTKIPAQIGVNPNGITKWGCLSFCVPFKPTWFYLKAINNGNIQIDISPNADNDLDFIVWGPFDSLPTTGGQLSNTLNTVTCNPGNPDPSGWCSYDKSRNESVKVTAVKDKYYVLLVSNYRGINDVEINFTTSQGGNLLDCSPVCSNLNVDVDVQDKGTYYELEAKPTYSNVSFSWSNGSNDKIINVSKISGATHTVTVSLAGCTNTAMSSYTVTSFSPIISGQSLLCETCENNPSAIINSNCPSGTTTYWKKRNSESDSDLRVTGNSIDTKTFGAGIYKVYCKDVNNVDSPISAPFEVKSFSVTKSPNVSEICTGINNSISLKANNKTADFKWKTATGTLLTSDEVLEVTAKGDYYAECPALNYRIKVSITECSRDPQIVIASENGTSLCGSSSININATTRDCTSGITWKIEDKLGERSLTEQSNKLVANEVGKYWATCTGGGKTATSNPINITNGNPSAPTIEGNPSNIVKPNQALLEADGCTGTNETTKWYRKVGSDYQLQTSTGSSFNTSSIGTYVAVCSHSTCGNSDYSNEVFVTESIAVTADKPKVRTIESVTLTVSGCIGNTTKIQWKKDNTFLSLQQGKNPISEIGPANYYARCVPSYYSSTSTNDDTNYPWVVAMVGLKLYDGPTVAASLSEAYVTETINLTATGCPSDAGYQWNIKGTIVNQQNPSSTGPGTYYARCTYSGGGGENWSDWVGVTVAEKENESITPTGPLKAYEVEQVNLSATGCAHHQAGIQWYIKGAYYGGRNQITTGPGTYRVRCNIGNVGPWVDITVYPRDVEAISLTASKNPIYDNENITLTASGCADGTIQWFFPSGETIFGQTSRPVRGAGFYQARCTVGNQTGPMASVNVGMIPPPIPTITANKLIVSPFETVTLTGDGCSMGYIQWDTPSGLIMGNPLDYTGPGTFRARCVITDRSISDWSIPLTLAPAPPGAITIITSKTCVFPNEVITLTTNSCSEGTVNWTLPDGSTESGRTIDAIGTGVYKVFCLRFGVSGTETSITLSQCQGEVPTITTDRTRARPNEIVTVSLSGCTTNEWYWAKVTYPDNTTKTFEKNFTVTGPFKLDAACVYTWGLGTQRKAEVFLIPGDGLKVVSNKTRVAANETATLTAYGCDFGQLEWKWGTTGSAGNVNPLTVTGPGTYKVRCINDPLTNSEWVTTILAPSSDIGAIVVGATKVCPNNPIVLNASGCPDGWYYQWYTAEKGWNNGGTSLTVYLPQTILVRCNKPDNSYYSPTKEYVVDSPFSETFKATNTGPISIGQSATLTATNITDATYEWKNPAGVVIATTRTYTIPTVTAEDAGIYTIKATIGTGANVCETIATTDLGINVCDDFVLRSKNGITGEYTNRMPRKPNKRDEYDPLIITVENQEGVKPKFLQPTWSGPSGSFTTGEDLFTIQAKTIGQYSVTLLSTNGQTCVVKTDLTAQPCTLLDNSFKTCGTSGAGTIDGAEKLTALAVGDYFNAGDYEVQVTEVDAGGGNGIWSGKGYTTVAMKGGIEADVAVQFTNVEINACYQLIAGATSTSNFVEAQPDLTWSNMVQPSKFIEMVGDFFDDFANALANFDKKAKSGEATEAAIALAEMGEVIKNSINEDEALTEAERAPAVAEFEAVIKELNDFGGAENLRMANPAVDCGFTDWQCMYDKATSAYDKYLGVYLTKLNSIINSGAPIDGGFIPQGVYINSSPRAFMCGLLDGAYSAAVDAGSSLYSVGHIISCLNVTAFVRPDCKEKFSKMWEGVQGMVTIMTTEGSAGKIWDGLVQEANKWVDNNTGGQPINRYYNGRTTFEIASMFVGAGTVAAGLKLVKATKLASAIKTLDVVTDKLDVTSRIMSKVGVSFKKLGSKTGKFVIRNSSGTIIGTALEVVDGVFVNCRKRVGNTYNQFLGYVDGTFKFTDGTTKKGRCKMWGSCSISPNANARMAAQCPDGDGTALEFITKVLNVSKRKMTFSVPQSPDWLKNVMTGARNFQQKINKWDGDPDLSYDVDCPTCGGTNRVSFDAHDGANKVLIDAKYGYQNKIFDKEGEILETNYADGRLKKLVGQVERQLKSIMDSEYKIEWHCSNSIAAAGINNFFKNGETVPTIIKDAISNGTLIIKHIKP